MEVHHHPDFRKKNFQEYIFEGLMIFMAVMLGFFAERLRENLTEHAKEKEFIVSMIEDAQSDILSIKNCIVENKIRVLKLDTMCSHCFNYGLPGHEDPMFYKVITACIRHPFFVSPVERTMTQLKNAGSMRLIQNSVAINSIVSYDDISKKLVNQQEYYELDLKVLLDATEQLFNLKYYPLNHKTFFWEPDPIALESAQLIVHNENKIIEFGNKAKLFQGIVMFYIVRLEEAQEHAAKLVETLKREYYLK